MTAITEAMTAAYFDRPPHSDWVLAPEGGLVLGALNPWSWSRGFELFVNDRTGETRPWVGPGKPRRLINSSRQINAEVQVDEAVREWKDADLVAETGIGLEGETGRIIHVEGVAKRLRGEEWKTEARAKQAPLRRAEQKRRAKGYHPSMRNVTPRDHMTDEDRAHFIRQARETMANLCSLSHFLPMTKILATKWAVRMCEMVEWEQINIFDWSLRLKDQLAEAYRARGSIHGGDTDENPHDNLEIDRLEQQLEGARFQYYHCQLLFHAFKEQLTDVALEYGSLMASTQFNSNARLGIEHSGRTGVQHDGRTVEYVSVVVRQQAKKAAREQVRKASAVHNATLHGKGQAEFDAYYAKQTGFKPRKGPWNPDGATSEVAQPMSDREIDFDPADRD